MGRITYEKIEGEDGEKLDELFGIKDCLVEVNPGRVILPPDYKDIGERIMDLKVRKDDVWLISYPRTGSTWAQEMIWCIGNDLDYEKAKQIQQLRTPLLELSAIMAHHHGDWMKELGNSVDLVENLTSPRFIKSHLPWELLPKDLKIVQPKVVYVARNPKDMCVSYYHYCQLVHNMKGSFEDFCHLFLKDKAPIGPIWNHILGFWNRRNENNILFLKYEDMKKDQKGAIKKAAKFLNKNLSDEDVEKLAEHLSFNKMKENPAVNLEPLMSRKEGFSKNSQLKFIRKGQIGDYKNFMSDELIKKFDTWTENNLKGTGLTFETV
ncbi:conserved hypothetical protein [Pediculus humanus corporis]|uniref:Sulfotransferase domain-containing protein n=1 Tax=Pediculus humanus subsp. corporis TaxID=121224 RepID=E0VVB6_PEDHC|nr:uncharacterized protein Phum_PHUM461020 [Pediculus humanus corporis]EEB17322.1 conserved hypothetical protein [Pediculus humanus corporis]